ncbi:hypothetical protein [Deinococcus peraridilitoris]|uniref:Uncharacterized protein n=1 Tax=Deinococcus peraridilitoris (strain DSM 19664 / LMG 22246 / CIP 109416 / KR-200) TaxID=937777 RepID=L0A1W2_DEIPD|nr:hypothetical protein [Deinococcus peraridilitoris]AFZ67000.1 hypothetical protein Deipe_1459 [Deinococcus peraridilitoris DSM 19664]
MKKRERTEPYGGSPLCGAKLRGKEATCRNAAGFKTDHPSQGKCYLHGGKTPVKHGRYSLLKHARLRELLEQAEQDPDPLDLTQDVLLMRAVVHDYLDRHGLVTDAILAWHASFNHAFESDMREWRKAFAEWIEECQHLGYEEGEPPELPLPEKYAPKPRQVPDIAGVVGLLGQVGAMADRIQKHKQQQSLSMAAVNHLLEQFAVEVLHATQEVISDPATRTKLLENVERRWATIPVLGKPGS